MGLGCKPMAGFWCPNIIIKFKQYANFNLFLLSAVGAPPHHLLIFMAIQAPPMFTNYEHLSIYYKRMFGNSPGLWYYPILCSMTRTIIVLSK